jgi:hypothetical protein
MMSVHQVNLWEPVQFVQDLQQPMHRCGCTVMQHLLITMLHVIVVTSLLGRFSAGANANILWSVGVKTRAEAKDALARLQAAGMDTIDVSSMPSAQVSGLLLVVPVP